MMQSFLPRPCARGRFRHKHAGRDSAARQQVIRFWPFSVLVALPLDPTS